MPEDAASAHLSQTCSTSSFSLQAMRHVQEQQPLVCSQILHQDCREPERECTGFAIRQESARSDALTSYST
eukprot:6212651-Pleurochrysis_carterae.AAC.5